MPLQKIGFPWLFYHYFQEESKGIFKGTPYKVDFIVVRLDDPMVSAVVNRSPEYYENKMTEPFPQYPNQLMDMSPYIHSADKIYIQI